MTRAEPILVGVDSSPASSNAIRFAAQEARRQGCGIRLVHVVPNYVPITPMLPLAPADLEETGREVLRAAAAEAHEFVASKELTTCLLDGPRVPSLLEAAEHAGMLVLGSAQRPAIERLLTGSTLFGVAARATCPVVAVPRLWDPNVQRRTVVAGVKSLEHSPELVRRTLEIAADRKAGVVLVHAWELPNEYDDLITSRVDQSEWADRARRAIERSLAGLRDAYAEVPVELRVIHGQPARVLHRASSDADLLVVARRHRAFPVGHLGGTGRALLRESQCPVEVVPPADVPTGTPDLVLESDGTLRK